MQEFLLLEGEHEEDEGSAKQTYQRFLFQQKRKARFYVNYKVSLYRERSFYRRFRSKRMVVVVIVRLGTREPN